MSCLHSSSTLYSQFIPQQLLLSLMFGMTTFFADALTVPFLDGFGIHSGLALSVPLEDLLRLNSRESLASFSDSLGHIKFISYDSMSDL